MNALATAASQLQRLREALVAHAMELVKRSEEDGEGIATLEAISHLLKVEKAIARAQAVGREDPPILPTAKKSPRKRSPRPRHPRDTSPPSIPDDGDDFTSHSHAG